MMEPRADDAMPNTRRKALALNLDPLSDGVFSEAGGGQEVTRWFFEVGGAASTVAKTISAYDMAMGDALYGPAQRYVSRQRLEAMLEYEFAQLTAQLGPRRGDTTRVEVDMIRFTGPAFPRIDNRPMALKLVEQGLTDAAILAASGDVMQPADVLHKRPILVERGSFRPATNLTLDLLQRAREQFLKEPSVAGQEPVVLAEMTLRSVGPDDDAGHADFLALADILRALGLDVLISRFEPYYQLADYLAAYSGQLIGMAVGLSSVREIADQRYYTDLPGGVLEAAGPLFKRSVKLYVYLTRDVASGAIQTVEHAPIPPPWHYLRDLLLDVGSIEPIRRYDERFLAIRTPDVRARIEAGDDSWMAMVPAVVADTIKSERLFGYGAGRTAS